MPEQIRFTMIQCSTLQSSVFITTELKSPQINLNAIRKPNDSSINFIRTFKCYSCRHEHINSVIKAYYSSLMKFCFNYVFEILLYFRDTTKLQ
jgi:hypothetical protein